MGLFNPSATNQLMLAELRSRGHYAEMLSHPLASYIVVTLADGSRHYLYGAVIEQSSAVGMRINQNKYATYLIARTLDIPVAAGMMVDSRQDTAELRHFCEEQWAAGHDLLVKPIDTDHGAGITAGITDMAGLQTAIDFAKLKSNRIIVQRRHAGNDCRIVVVDGKCVAALMRRAPIVTGNGASTVAELVTAENERRQRTNDGMVMLHDVKPDEAERYLGREVYASVPADGTEIELLGVANFGRGGITQDITDTIHQSYKDAAIRLTQELKLVVCGVDFMVTDHTLPMTVGTSILLEVNCAIGLRLHHYPTYGEPRNVAAAIVDAFEKYTLSKNVAE